MWEAVLLRDLDLRSRVSSERMIDARSGVRKGPRIVGQNKAGRGFPPPLFDRYESLKILVLKTHDLFLSKSSAWIGGRAVDF